MATFGYDTIGGSEDSAPTGYMIGCKFTAPEDGTITKITAYCRQYVGASTAKIGIYEDDSAPALNWALLTESNAVALPAASAWTDFTANYVMTLGEVLWFGLLGSTGERMSYDAGGHNQKAHTWGNSYPTMPDPYDQNFGPGYNPWKFSLYATYTPAGPPPAVGAGLSGGSVALMAGTMFEFLRLSRASRRRKLIAIMIKTMAKRKTMKGRASVYLRYQDKIRQLD